MNQIINQEKIVHKFMNWLSNFLVFYGGIGWTKSLFRSSVWRTSFTVRPLRMLAALFGNRWGDVDLPHRAPRFYFFSYGNWQGVDKAEMCGIQCVFRIANFCCRTWCIVISHLCVNGFNCSSADNFTWTPATWTPATWHLGQLVWNCSGVALASV